MNEEKLSYMMLFCALVLVSKTKATMEQSLAVVPLGGKAKYLASELITHFVMP